jgi:hypothetical protein
MRIADAQKSPARQRHASMQMTSVNLVTDPEIQHTQILNAENLA